MGDATGVKSRAKRFLVCAAYPRIRIISCLGQVGVHGGRIEVKSRMKNRVKNRVKNRTKNRVKNRMKDRVKNRVENLMKWGGDLMDPWSKLVNSRFCEGTGKSVHLCRSERTAKEMNP